MNNEIINPNSLIARRITYSEVEKIVLQVLPDSQIALKIVLAVALSAQNDNSVMLWMLLVGVPSSGKTDLVRLIKDSSIAYYLDNITQNAFISGERVTKTNKVYDLLPVIDKKCLVIKDWTAVLSHDEKVTKKLFGDLVGIYDKEFTKFSSRRGNISYASNFSQLGCITPATLGRNTTYMNMIGPRFLCYAIPKLSEEAINLSYESIFSDNSNITNIVYARKIVSSYIDQLSKDSLNIKDFDNVIELYLRIASELIAHCRGITITKPSNMIDQHGEEIRHYEVQEYQVEEPWRALKQLILLARYLAFVTGKNEVTATELIIIKDVVLSSMPTDRSQALRAIISNKGIIKAIDLSYQTTKSTKTSRRLLDTLTSLGVISKENGSGSVSSDYTISNRYKDFLLLETEDFLSAHNSGTENSGSISTT